MGRNSPLRIRQWLGVLVVNMRNVDIEVVAIESEIVGRGVYAPQSFEIAARFKRILVVPHPVVTCSYSDPGVVSENPALDNVPRVDVAVRQLLNSAFDAGVDVVIVENTSRGVNNFDDYPPVSEVGPTIVSLVIPKRARVDPFDYPMTDMVGHSDFIGLLGYRLIPELLFARNQGQACAILDSNLFVGHDRSFNDLPPELAALSSGRHQRFVLTNQQATRLRSMRDLNYLARGAYTDADFTRYTTLRRGSPLRKLAEDRISGYKKIAKELSSFFDININYKI